MSDTDSDSEVQINIRPNRNNFIRDESLDECSDYESQNEQDFEQPPMSNVNVDVSSPLDPVGINTSQSEPLDAVARVPHSQGNTALVDIPGRRSPAYNLGIPDQHSNAIHPSVDIPGRRSPPFNVGIPDQHSNATHPRVDIPGQRSPPFNVGIPDQHSNATHPRVDIPGRRPPPFNVGIHDQHSNATHPRVDIPGRRLPPFNVGIPDQHSNAKHPRVDIPGRRQRLPAFNVDSPDQHSNATYPRVDYPGRRRRSPGYNAAFQGQQRSYHEIPVRNNDICAFDSAGRSRASNRNESADCGTFGTSLGYRSSTSISAATLRTFSRDRESPGPERHTGSPSPHYYRPRRRSRPQTRNFRDLNKRNYSPYSRQHQSFDYEQPLHSSGRGDMNHSYKENMTISRGMSEYREQSPQWPGLYPEPYDNNPYETQSDYKQCRSRMDFEDERISYPSYYQSGPRIKPDPYTGNEDLEEYQSYFEDCAELSRWDPHSKVLFLAASFKGQARTYYMSLDAYDKRSYSALVYKMRQRFGSNKHALKWLNQLELRQRQPKESIVAL